MYIGENYMGVGYDERNEKISRTKIEGFGICHESNYVKIKKF